MRIRQILDVVESHALASGHYSRVNRHEPKSKNAATDGITCAIWVQRITPIGDGSGLAESSVRLELTVRSYASMLAEPQDEIDPRVVDAADALMAAYHGDFQLGGEARHVDIFGAYGERLEATAGYLSLGGMLFRVIDIRLPIVLDDLYPQAA